MALFAGCGAPQAAAQPQPPAHGLMLLSLADGHTVAQLALGEDPLAVAVSENGASAYVSDNRPGEVYAIDLTRRAVAWRRSVGGRPGPLLASGGRLLVSLYESGAVAELDPATGKLLALHPAGRGPGQLAADAGGDVWVACADGSVWDLGGNHRPAAAGFGLAFAGGSLWAAAYDTGELIRLEDGRHLRLPGRVHPFWLAAGEAGRLLVAAEGDDEDRDPGAVLAVDTSSLEISVLDRPRDPDQVAESGGIRFVAAHADRSVRVLDGTRLKSWAGGAEVVALAPDPRLGLLLVLTNARE